MISISVKRNDLQMVEAARQLAELCDHLRTCVTEAVQFQGNYYSLVVWYSAVSRYWRLFACRCLPSGEDAKVALFDPGTFAPQAG